MLYMAWSIRQFMSISRKGLGLFPLQRTWTVSSWVILPAYYQYQGFKTAEAFGLGQKCTNFPKNTDPIWMLFPQRLADASWEWRNQWTFNKGVCIVKKWKFSESFLQTIETNPITFQHHPWDHLDPMWSPNASEGSHVPLCWDASEACSCTRSDDTSIPSMGHRLFNPGPFQNHCLDIPWPLIWTDDLVFCLKTYLSFFVFRPHLP